MHDTNDTTGITANDAARPNPPFEEPRVSVVVTVGWMLGGLSTFAAEVLAVGLKSYGWLNDEMPNWLPSVTELLFLVALVSGLFTLLMTVVCLRVRPAPPPRPITRTVFLVASAPVVVLVAQWLVG